MCRWLGRSVSRERGAGSGEHAANEGKASCPRRRETRRHASQLDSRLRGNDESYRNSLLSITGFVALCCVFSATAFAGGGPENVLVVINQNSDDSKHIANEYVALRNIPSRNVVYVDYKGGLDQCPGERFRGEVLAPLLKAIDDRQLSAQIDCIAYSADLPWRILMQGDFPDKKFPKSFAPNASITGATFLYRHTVAKNARLFSATANEYMPGEPGANTGQCRQLGDARSQGFRSRYAWSQRGTKSDDPAAGESYLLSTMLGVTSGRGLSVDQVIANLKRSVSADGAQPGGTFYFVRNNDIRSKTRHACYDEAVKLLAAEGARAEVLDGVLPTGKQDVLGIMMGKASFSVKDAGMKILPGALCDNLTSYGGEFIRPYQVPLTDFLDAGAAGASGTVWEPTAMQAKFPLPTLFVHYRRGCSLAESFYQSISCPYQILVVGDPLCRPWAKIPQLAITGLDSNGPTEGVVSIGAEVSPTAGESVKECELFIDGRFIARLPATQVVRIDTAKLPPGHHVIRFVAMTDDAIETRGGAAVDLMVADRPTTTAPRMQLIPGGITMFGESFWAKLDEPAGQGGVEICQHQRVVATIAAGEIESQIDSKLLGRGPVPLRAVDKATGCSSPPVNIIVR